MSDIEKARSNLKISGYQHPTNVVKKNLEKYKTLNTESKNAKYSTSKFKSSYASFPEKPSTMSEKSEDKQCNINFCPVCKKKEMYACKCTFKDRQCVNGHVWYINKHGSITTGDPHE
jgi:hypothetical protein